MPTAADRLLNLLEEGGAQYRLIRHAPEGRTDRASLLRGHPPEQAAKCIVVRVKISKRQVRFVLAVVPGDRRVDLDRIRESVGGRDAGFADRQTAERLAGTVSGTIMPFAFDAELELIVDPALLETTDIFFNAAALDRSVALRTTDYLRLARPTLLDIAQGPGLDRTAPIEQVA
ncbi:YbaK/EbsC family protein [Micromonospora sp. MH99]|uniref:YbaK/EbsC family protein n=1 Tax=Micromonospora sp. MH99 TaxID=1945510 RepID=UPI001F31885D|nr:YbaK/EbsC family protein [Micromonospora sp. MH99]